MLAFYSWTIFLSAFLLFSIQPIVGKILLPLLGGSPGVWNVCMVFFQALLFTGYLYAARLGKLSRVGYSKITSIFHVSLWVIAIGLAPRELPIAGNFGSITFSHHPTIWLLMMLGIWIGIPFLALSSTSTLIQNWFGTSTHRLAKDPYFLYAAGNIGSLLALIAYPILIEPHFHLGTQIQIWRILFLFLGLCIAFCAIKAPTQKNENLETLKISWNQSLEWTIYAFIPSSLLLGVTTYISTDIASIPLLWIIPLILYLLTFVLVFSKTFSAIKKHFNSLGRLLAFGAILCVVGICVGANHPSVLFIPLHLMVFLLSCIICHGKLADSRPAISSLGTYYLCIALGGVLGGAMNSLLAPLIFNDVVEYPLVIIFTCWMRSKSKIETNQNLMKKDWINAIIIFGLICALGLGASWLNLPNGRMIRLIILGPPIILCYRMVQNTKSYALALFSLFLAANFFVSSYGHELIKQRTFFGTIRVVEDDVNHFMLLFHGSTLHGQQKIGSLEPLSYYHSSGPVGDLFKVTQSFFPIPENTNIGVVGMGTGTLASYARKLENWTFFELDPSVVEIASQKKYFTFLSESAVAGKYLTVIGDARLRLKEVQDHQYSLLLMDAFSSDSIPTHLITQQAVKLAWSKIAPHGLLAFHISNRFFDLVPVMASLAQHSGASAFIAEDLDNQRSGKSMSKWAVLVRNEDVQNFKSLNAGANCQWKSMSEMPRYSKIDWSKKIWSDDYFDLISLLFPIQKQ